MVAEKEWELIPMNYDFFLFRFTSVVDRDDVLNNGPWVVEDATLCLEQ